MPATTPLHHLRSRFNALDSFAVVWELPHGDGTSTAYFRMGTASGPVEPMFEDLGELKVGAELRLAYNYATNEYMNQTGGWLVTVKRINQKSITVTADGRSHRLER